MQYIQNIAPIYRLSLAILAATGLGHFLPASAAVIVLPPGIILCLIARIRLPALFLLFALITQWRLAPPPIPAHPCQLSVEIRDFPSPILPRGLRLPVHILASPNCPALTGRQANLFAYQHHPFPLASRWQITASLRIDGRRLFATVKDAAPLAEAGHLLHRLRAAVDAHTENRWFKALLIGNRSALTAADRSLLRTTGTTHLLAISGLHVGLVALITYWISTTLWSLRRRWTLAIAPRDFGLIMMLLAALAYTILSGAQPPALRAWLMLLGISLHWFIPRIHSGLQGLALAATISLLLDPAILTLPGAWLSYFATLLVILGFTRYAAFPALVQWPLLQAWISLAITPLIWAWFGGISVIAFLANLIILPWLGPLLLLGFLALLGSAWQSAAYTLLEYCLATLRALARLPYAYIEPRWQPGLLAAIVACALITALLARLPGKRYLILLLFAAVLWPLRPQAPVLYQTPNGNAAIIHGRKESIIINPGYRYRERDDAKRYLLPELRRRARHPRAILITSAKKRHNSALKTLLDTYPDTPVYRLIPLKDYPFPSQYCPEPPFSPDCTLHFAGYRIDKNGITGADPP